MPSDPTHCISFRVIGLHDCPWLQFMIVLLQNSLLGLISTASMLSGTEAHVFGHVVQHVSLLLPGHGLGQQFFGV